MTSDTVAAPRGTSQRHLEPFTVALNCDTNSTGVEVTETLTAGGSSLNFGGDQYNYVWKTERSWAGTCRQLVLTLNDGSVHTANFKFK